jgi:DNA-directed RNA polymerase specialized sigma24 family protein
MFQSFSSESIAKESAPCGGGSTPAEALRAVREELGVSYSRFRSIARYRLRDNAAADDVVQTFALKALERSNQIRDLRAVRSWLRRSFDTTLIDFCRGRTVRRQREVSFDIELHDRLYSTAGDLAADPTQSVVAVLGHLKSDYADAIYRLDLLDQPKEAVAADLGITLNNLTVRVHRARRAFRAALEDGPILSKRPLGHSDLVSAGA